jgi:hypothetical protein
MLGRLLRCAILLHACWWFGWFAPAHQRGSVVLPGDTRGQATECATQAARQPAGGVSSLATR